MLTGKQKANVVTVALIFDLIGDPVKYSLDPNQAKGGSSLTATVARLVFDMSTKERTVFFEKWLDRLTTEERAEFRFFVGNGHFKADADAKI